MGCTGERKNHQFCCKLEIVYTETVLFLKPIIACVCVCVKSVFVVVVFVCLFKLILDYIETVSFSKLIVDYVYMYQCFLYLL